jgi:hypothetical protein
MNKLSKTILISTIALLGAGVLFVSPTQADPPNLEVEFQNDPLFSEANFMPGDGVTRWVKVTNNTTQTQPIDTWAINVNNSDNLGDLISLEIKEGVTSLYNDTFSSFFTGGNVFLSNLAGNGTQTQYDFIATFDPGTDNDYQGKSLGFDIVIGFPGEGQCTDNDGDDYYVEGGDCGPVDCDDTNPNIYPGANEICGNEIDEDCDGDDLSCTTSGGGGIFGGGSLIITDEENTRICADFATLSWFTNLSATSRVVYDNLFHSVLGGAPNYGYAFSTSEDSSKILSHSVTIIGLTPETTYYWRAVSRTLVLDEVSGEELAFTTPLTGCIGEEVLGEAQFLGEEVPLDGEVVGPETEEEGMVLGEETSPGNLLATVAPFFESTNFCWLFLILIIILICLYLISYKRMKSKKKKWLFFLGIIILIILYIYFCCTICWVWLLLALLIIALAKLFRKKKVPPQPPEMPGIQQ